MAHALTDSAVWADIVVPDDGDNRNAASVQTPLQQLANRTASLRQGVPADFEVGGLLNVAGINCSGNLQAADVYAPNVGGDHVFANSRDVLGPGVIGSDSDASYSPATVRYVHWFLGGLSANRGAAVTSAGSADSDEMAFSNADATYNVTVFLPGGSSRIIGVASGNTQRWCRAKKIAGNWYFVAGGETL